VLDSIEIDRDWGEEEGRDCCSTVVVTVVVTVLVVMSFGGRSPFWESFVWTWTLVTAQREFWWDWTL
jgi:hypothetical protein